MNNALKIFVVTILVLAALVFAFTLSIDGMVKSKIEESGTELFQTEVNIDDLDISIFGGTGEIEGFTIANPEGFSDEEAVRIDQMNMKVDLGTLFSDQVIVEELIIKSPVLFFEQQGVGINLRKLKDNMDLSGGEEDQKTIVIDYLRVEDGLVRVSTDIDKERKGEAGISSLELEGVGRNGSNTMKQTVRQIMEPLLERAVAEAVKGGILDQVQEKVQDLIDG